MRQQQEPRCQAALVLASGTCMGVPMFTVDVSDAGVAVLQVQDNVVNVSESQVSVQYSCKNVLQCVILHCSMAAVLMINSSIDAVGYQVCVQCCTACILHAYLTST